MRKITIIGILVSDSIKNISEVNLILDSMPLYPSSYELIY